jgi:NADPH:quinone reductase-like Zn-dependent oxidoreductase
VARSSPRRHSRHHRQQRFARKGWSVRVRGVFFIVEPNRAQLIEIARLIDTRSLRAIVEATFPLAKARDAFEHRLRGHDRGKVVLAIDGQGSE